MANLNVGDEVYSNFFKAWLKIVEIKSDTEWWFEINGRRLKAQTPLSYWKNGPSRKG